MKEATFDPARELTLYFRCNRAGSKNFVFTHSDGTAYSFIYDELELNIYKNQGDKKKLISLNHVFGIALSSNTVTASITKALSNIPEGEYYWELYRTDLEETWLTGKAQFHNGIFDGVNTDSESITVVENGESISIMVTNPSSAPVSSATWGNIGGTLSNQTDLNSALAAKLSVAAAAATYETIANVALKQNLVNSATALVDGSTIDLTAIKHTLTTSSATRTFTISYTGDDITLEVTLSATASTFTFPATSLCVSEGVASGDNTCALSGVSGDKYIIAIKKIGSAYYVVCKNFGQ